jgi:hypothetical protein
MTLKIFFVFITSFTCITACYPKNLDRLSVVANKLWYGDFANFKQWNITSSIRENMREVVKDPLGSGDMVLKVLYPRGSYAGGLPGGTAFVLKMQNTDHASLEYDLLFPQSFDFVKVFQDGVAYCYFFQSNAYFISKSIRDVSNYFNGLFCFWYFSSKKLFSLNLRNTFQAL